MARVEQFSPLSANEGRVATRMMAFSNSFQNTGARPKRIDLTLTPRQIYVGSSVPSVPKFSDHQVPIDSILRPKTSNHVQQTAASQSRRFRQQRSSQTQTGLLSRPTMTSSITLGRRRTRDSAGIVSRTTIGLKTFSEHLPLLPNQRSSRNQRKIVKRDTNDSAASNNKQFIPRFPGDRPKVEHKLPDDPDYPPLFDPLKSHLGSVFQIHNDDQESTIRELPAWLAEKKRRASSMPRSSRKKSFITSHTTPSETIACHFTPKLAGIRLSELFKPKPINDDEYALMLSKDPNVGHLYARSLGVPIPKGGSFLDDIPPSQAAGLPPKKKQVSEWSQRVHRFDDCLMKNSRRKLTKDSRELDVGYKPDRPYRLEAVPTDEVMMIDGKPTKITYLKRVEVNPKTKKKKPTRPAITESGAVKTRDLNGKVVTVQPKIQPIIGALGFMSRPVSPEVQLGSKKKALEDFLGQKKLSKDALGRYRKYLQKIPSQLISTALLMQMIRRILVKHLVKNRKKQFWPNIKEMLGRVRKIYFFSVKKAILNYILLSEDQRKRLRLEAPVPKPALVSIRAPVSWHIQYKLAQDQARHNLHVTNPIMMRIQNLFLVEGFSAIRMFSGRRTEQRCRLPLSPSEFEEEVMDQCTTARAQLMKRWVPACAKIFVELKSHWQHLVPKKNSGSSAQIAHLFAAASSLMSLHLREIVVASLAEFLEYFQKYSNGNTYEGPYVDLTFVTRPTLRISVEVSKNGDQGPSNQQQEVENAGAEAIFFPHLTEVKQVLLRCISYIVQAGMELPRVESVLFPGQFQDPMRLRHVHENEEVVHLHRESLLAAWNKNLAGPTAYIKVYEGFKEILDGSARRDLQKFLSSSKKLEEFEAAVESRKGSREAIQQLRRTVPLELMVLDCSAINDVLAETLLAHEREIIRHQIDLNAQVNASIISQFEEMSRKLSASPTTTAELVNLLRYLYRCTDVVMKELKKKIAEASQRLGFLMDYALLPAERIKQNADVYIWLEEMQMTFEQAYGKLMAQRDKTEASLKKRVTAFEEELVGYQQEVEAFKRKDPPVLNLDEMRSNAKALDRLGDLLSKARSELDAINTEEELLEMEPTLSPLLQHLISLREPYDKLWHTAMDFTQKHERWFHGAFVGLNAEDIQMEVEAMWRTMYKLSKTFADQPGPRRVADVLRSKIDKFKQHLPVLHCICNPGLRDRHWREMSEAVGVELIVTEESTLAMMIEYGLPKVVKKLEEISAVASKEYSLEKALVAMKSTWASVKFDLIPYRESGVSILTAVDEVQVLLDDHILKAQTMRGSPYIRALEAEFRDWEETLLSMQDVLDAWLKCQGTWLYLEPIFSSEDILQQMPVEGRKFVRVDRTWRDIMAYAMKHPLALEATNQPEMLRRLQECNSLLDDIQKGLNDYLEKKRLYFPRFFFLSNEELLEILSETKDASRVQPHLRKCFEGIFRLSLTPDQVITGMVSEEGESVEFIDEVVPAKARGLVERWLLDVEGAMVSSMRAVTKRAVEAFNSMPYTKWVLEWPGQVVLCASNIFWTAHTVEAMANPQALKDHLSRCSKQIEDIVGLVKDQGLSSGSRTTLEALLVIEVHARDIVEKLVENKVTSAQDFTWVSQLRYYWNEFDSLVTVSMIATDIQYGYEYLGNTGRLVITPLTDRTYRTLMGALRLHLGGAPEGPAGTGKTETCKDLAKAMAKKCVVFNCSEGLDYKAMGKFIKGLAQSGAWACFDEFNRIELEVLSVVAQQVSCLQTAIAQGAPTLHFEGSTLRLDPTCSIFITMNPGKYAGRQQLPDNLKVLFRTVAMMVPDYALIAENSLYSYGFVNARDLAGKIVDVYRLCSEQLSSQHHYDYGMRAMKAVLTAARNLRLKNPELDEARLVLRAIMDVNRPKFLSQDIPLFDGIISDLFPAIELAPPDYAILTDCLKAVMAERNLQPTPWFVEKTVQLYEMLLVRHGLMLVGESMGGKTSSYQCLAAALTMAAEKYPTLVNESKVNYRIINPKALDLGHLYGCFEKVSHEWSDGILANTFREMATTNSPDRQWLILDGPVDAFWIENMNTVLDDNRKLCLMSGEIIQMSKKMNVIFEVGDLEHASPATVSRCGMIYLEPKRLGWQPLRDSFLTSINKYLIEEQQESLQDMTEWIIQPCLTFIEENCTTFVATSELHLVQSLARMFECLVVEAHEHQQDTFHGVAALNWMQCLFLFAVVWSMGAILTGESRLKFDEFFRQLILGFNLTHPKPKTFKLQRNQLFPETGTVFDFVFERKDSGHWVTWMDIVNKKSLQIAPNAKVSELLIPTDETSRQQYFLKLLLTHKKPLIFVGPTGTGKSAIISHHLMSLPKEKYLPNVLSFSARTSATQAQDVIMTKLDRRRKGVYGPAMGKTCILFIDDLNMPQKEQFGAQAPIELLRQWIDHGYWFDRKDTSRLEIIDTLLVAAMCPPWGGGRNDISLRFMRHLNVLGIEAFDDSNLAKIFGSIIEWHFSKGFELSIVRMGKAVIAATLDLYKAATKYFRPTPAKSHYVFNLRDFSRVIRGILLVPSTHLNDSQKLIRLWTHEVTRSFYDRLIDDFDRQKFVDILKDSCQNNFKQPLDRAVLGVTSAASMSASAAATSSGSSKAAGPTVDEGHLKRIMFGDYFYPDADTKIYDEVANVDRLTSVMESYLSEYNMVSKTPMSIVMFQFAIDHVSRLSRVLKQDSGHALLIGMGGSGRQSCCKLAAFIAGYELYQLEMSRNYGHEQWRDDLKKIMMKAGGEGKPTVFLFTDSQIKDESFVEDINMLLNTGDIPNLYPPDERAEILERMQAAAREQGRKIDPSPLSLYNFFVERVKRNLHIFLVMSPIGEAFRIRLRMFPSLINCCTIDWFTPWPEEALERVATKFLSQVDLDDEIRTKCVTMCKHFHQTVVELSDRFRHQLGRPNYVTPTSFLELIMTFKNLLNVKRNEILTLRSRYVTGLQRLEYATSQIAVMQERETALRPQLMQLSAETEKLMIKIEKDTVNVESQKEVVAADEAASNEAAAAAQAIKDDCENELAEALPALNAAVSALNTLKPADITLVKAMKNPPGGVKLVLEAVCVMLDRKPERKADPAVLGKYIEDYWATSQKVLGDLRFLDTLRSYDKDNIAPHIMARIREKYILNPDFDPEVIKDVSRACVNLCKWVRAMEVYDRVNKIVAPKKARLQEAEVELEAQMGKLKDKRRQLQQVTDKLQALNDEFAANIKRKKELEDELALCSQKLDRAEKLIDGLGGEKERWSQTAEELGNRYDNITGDVLVSAAVIAYLGPFTADFRKECLHEWAESCVKEGIPCSVPFSLSATMGDPVKIRAWHMNGLPVDSFSIDNAIVVTNARRWPLMIDPQGQANKWIRNAEKDTAIAVLKLSDPGYLRTLETAVQFGRPVLLENIGEDLDPALEPLLARQTIKSGGVDYIKLGEQMIEFNPDFRLYMTTRMRNPHFVPEISVKVTILNFMLTSVGLEDQLLGIVAARERPQLETRKNQLIVEGAENKRKLKELEDRILEVLSAEGNILDDETGIQVLSSSKLLSEEIKKKELVIASTEEEIDSTRNQFKPVATHSSRLFFCISELANIDPMYQYSLVWFVRLYEQAIANSLKSDDIQQRVTYLNDHFTYSVYKNVCRSLFEKDKLLFAFSLCISILREKGKLQEDLLQFLLGGNIALENPHPNPGHGWLYEKAWSDIVQASQLPALEGLKESFAGSTSEWKKVYDALLPNLVPLPGKFENCNAMEKLVILKCIRPDKLIPAVQYFIVENMGANYVEPPAFDLAGSFADSSPRSPLIFVLSPGADPMAALVKFADLKGMSDRLKTISLGQGQGPIAAELIEEGVVEGGWVVLQNCHLAASWMPSLERLCEDVINTDKTNQEFRLWLTSYPSVHFPVSILQNGVKMTNEAPKGLKANLLRSYTNPPLSDPEFYSSCKRDHAWQRLLFGLCFFHALVQERRNFGPLGWNVPYEFNDSDLRISVAQLKLFLNEYDQIPFSALLYLTGECNYGGRVTDDKDRRLLMSLLSLVYCPDIVEKDKYQLTRDGQYYAPSGTKYNEFIDYIKTLPISSSPKAFGLHNNANITRENQETSELLAGLLQTQPQKSTARGSEAGAKSPSELALELANEILAKLPEPFNIVAVENAYPIQYNDSMNTVLRQEVTKYNRLLKEISRSLEHVCSAVQGLILMSSNLEDLYKSLLLGKVPASWQGKAYPSLKPLGSFINDFVLRLRFFQSWIDHGAPPVFWISAFFFAPSFLTGTLQNYARKYGAPIDRLTFKFSVTDHVMSSDHLGHDESLRLEDGVYIEGLYLEGAKWDWKNKVLAESEPKVLNDPLPIIGLHPHVLQDEHEERKQKENLYECPVYRTSARCGTLSTTGHSTNFIFNLELPSNEPSTHWINRGVAALSQLND